MPRSSGTALHICPGTWWGEVGFSPNPRRRVWETSRPCLWYPVDLFVTACLHNILIGGLDIRTRKLNLLANIGSAVTFAATIFFYWRPHIKHLWMSWNRQSNKITRLYDEKLKKKLDLSGKYQELNKKLALANKAMITEEKRVLLDENIVSMANQERKREKTIELNPANDPRLDAFVVVVEDLKKVDTSEVLRMA